MAFGLVIGVIFLIILPRIFMIFRPSTKPINGIYRQRDMWSGLKFWVFYLLLKLRKSRNKGKAHAGVEGAGYGMRSRETVEEMEVPQPLSPQHPQAVDAVYFNGANEEGYYFVGATARRQEKLLQTLIYIRIPELGLLELPSLPDTCLFREEELSYSTGGFKIQPVKPMKKWRLSYKGPMRLKSYNNEPDRTIDVSFDLDWIAGPGFFDFDTDLHPYALCEAMCREKWTREFFERLKTAHQTHYEQFGEIKGVLNVDNKAINLSVHGVRDHTYGNIRDWRMLHRYAIQYLTLEDGTSICAGLICMPANFSRLPIGYVCHKDGRIDSMEWIDFEFYDQKNGGDDGNPPEDFQFNFKAGDVIYNLKCHVIKAPIFYMGYEWEARIHERMCTFTVNGLKGWGISEWDYRNHTGRPNIYNKKDIGKRKE